MTDASLTLPPLSAVIEAARLQAWVERAQPGDSLLYATGPRLPRTTATAMLARELARIGLVDLVQPRGAHGFDFLAQRRSTPRPANAHALIDDDDTPEARLERKLRQAARLGTLLPTNNDLARACGLPDANAVKYRLKKLIDAHGFRLTDNGVGRGRGVVLRGFDVKPAHCRGSMTDHG